MKVGVETAREPVTELRFTLKSTDLRFVNYCYPSHLEYPKNTVILPGEHTNSAYIEFVDSREIDALIDVLVRFKDENARRMGCWL